MVLSSIEPHIVNNLRSFNTAKEMWDSLQRMYHQDNSAQKFQSWTLEITAMGISQLSSIIRVSYTYGVIILGWCNLRFQRKRWGTIQVVHSESQRDQFLIKLHPKFEWTRWVD